MPLERAVETLPTLFTRLTDQLTQLFDAKLALLRVELKEELQTYVRGAVMVIAGGVVAVIGFALLNVAIAFLISMLFAHTGLSQPAKYALGFIITALLYLVCGAFIVLRGKKEISRQRLVPPRTAAELEKDKQWLSSEL
ncbi:MAG: phage holin family protein [Verrucomicrobia bacterium]|nr:phage holin family protein [Verrucomicrobiota bacterium]